MIVLCWHNKSTHVQCRCFPQKVTLCLICIAISKVCRIEEFKNEKILPHIAQEEALEGNFLKYIYAQDVLYSNKIYGPNDDEDWSKSKKDEKEVADSANNDGSTD